MVTKTKAITLAAICAIFSAGAASYSTYYFMGKVMLWGMYMGSATDIVTISAILEAQKTGHLGKAEHLLELNLSSNGATLSGCIYDICKENNYPEFERALNIVSSYQFKYVNHNKSLNSQASPAGTPPDGSAP